MPLILEILCSSNSGPIKKPSYTDFTHNELPRPQRLENLVGGPIKPERS